MKNELPNETIINFAAVRWGMKERMFFFTHCILYSSLFSFPHRAKSYAIQTAEGRDTLRAKGVKKSYRNKMSFENYENVIKATQAFEILQYNLQSKDHVVKMIKQKKTAFSSLEDKRFYTCSIHSVPYNSILANVFRIKLACPFCQFPLQSFDAYKPDPKLSGANSSDMDTEIGSEVDLYCHEPFDFGEDFAFDLSLFDSEMNADL